MWQPAKSGPDANALANRINSLVSPLDPTRGMPGGIAPIVHAPADFPEWMVTMSEGCLTMFNRDGNMWLINVRVHDSWLYNLAIWFLTGDDALEPPPILKTIADSIYVSFLALWGVFTCRN